nr:hypothetical protein [Atopobium deltae]
MSGLNVSDSLAIFLGRDAGKGRVVVMSTQTGVCAGAGLKCCAAAVSLNAALIARLARTFVAGS